MVSGGRAGDFMNRDMAMMGEPESVGQSETEEDTKSLVAFRFPCTEDRLRLIEISADSR